MGEFAYCLNTSTVRPVPFREKIRIAAEAGFEAIEPWNDELDEELRSGGTIDDLRAVIDDSGLRVASMIALFGWTDPDPARHAVALEACKRKMEQAAALGSPYIVASPPDGPVDLVFASGRYAELLRIGRQIGVRPAMEFLGFVEGVHTLHAAMAIAEGTADSDASIVADVFHLMRGGGSIDDLLMLRGEQMAIFHINDLPAEPDPRVQTDSDRVMLGEGIADLQRVIANLRSISYRGPLSLELFNPTLWAADPVEVCRVGLDRMRALVEAG
jgi:2-keto-myo-inositol isomerase